MKEMKMTIGNIRTYSEIITLKTYEERFDYLKIGGQVGQETFGYDRYLNQILYNTKQWKKFRREIIIRDNACDLACEGYEINYRILVHHINPITVEDIINRNPMIFDPENAITTTHRTHNAIHYGDKNLLVLQPMERTPNDTCPWRH